MKYNLKNIKVIYIYIYILMYDLNVPVTPCTACEGS